MIWTALILGFAGSLHCLGMCSPLAMSVTGLSPGIVLSRVLYNAGRTLTYGMMGGVVAAVGLALPVFRYQNLLSVVMGIVLLVIGFVGVSRIRVPVVTTGMGKLSSFLRIQFGNLIQRKNYGSVLIMGMLNGLLPCGLSFLAITYCLTLSGPIEGFLFMVVFGLGTFPVMLGLTSLVSIIVHRFQFSFRHITTGMLILSGMLLIVRVFIVHPLHEQSIHQGVVDIVLCK